MSLIDRQAGLDVKVQAHALLGRAQAELGRRAARAEYGKVVATWKDPLKAAEAITGDSGESQAANGRRLGKALTSVGEAIFYFAERKREAADALQFPVYKGSGKAADVKKHINTKVAKWMVKKRKAIGEASVEYKKILDLQPAPPPRWVIAAGSRVGGLMGQFVADFRAAPIPKKMAKDIMLRQAYYASLDEASEPIKLQAKGAYSLCLNDSVKYQYFDDYSRACEKWLAENYKAEFHLIDEFKGDPNRVNRVLSERPYPLQLGGEPVLNLPKVNEPKKPQPPTSVKSAATARN